MKPIVAAVFLALTLGGCSVFQQVMPAKDTNPPKALKEFAPSVGVKTLWQVNTGSATGRDYIRINPEVDDSTIFVAGNKSASAHSKANGGVVWQTPIEAEITGGVSGGEGGIYLGTTNGTAIALDRQTGKPRWKAQLTSEVLAVSPASSGIVVFRTSDGRLHGLNSQSGEILWQAGKQSPVLSLRGAGTPLVIGSMVVSGFDSGVVAAFDLRSGRELWEATLSVPQAKGEVDRMTDVDGKLSAVGEALFAGSYNGQLVGINMRTGKIAWSAPYTTYSGVDADGSGLYTTSASGDVWKVAPQSGSPVWKMDDLERRQLTAPTIIGHYIVVNDAQGYIHWINADTGQFAARTHGDNAGYTSAPITDGNVIYTLGRSGVLTALTAQ